MDNSNVSDWALARKVHGLNMSVGTILSSGNRLRVKAAPAQTVAAPVRAQARVGNHPAIDGTGRTVPTRAQEKVEIQPSATVSNAVTNANQVLRGLENLTACNSTSNPRNAPRSGDRVS